MSPKSPGRSEDRFSARQRSAGEEEGGRDVNSRYADHG